MHCLRENDAGGRRICKMTAASEVFADGGPGMECTIMALRRWEHRTCRDRNAKE